MNNRRQGSQAGANRRPDAPATGRRSQRQTVEYEQSATADIQKREARRDPRMRSARNIRPTDSVRVLDNPRKPPDRTEEADRAFTGEVTGRSVRIERERQHAVSKAASAKPAPARPNRVFAALIVLAIVVVAGVVVYFSPAFLIKAIQVQGDWHLQPDRLTALAQVPADATLLRVDIAEIVERVAADPWVASVSVSRQFPSTLVLDIEEREPVALVVLESADQASGQGVWLLASDGVWLGQLSDLGDSIQGLNSGSLLLIEDASEYVLPVQGEMVSDPELVNALAIVNGFSPSMRSMVNYISAPSVVQTTLYLNNNVEVAFGSAEDVAAKEQVINQLISEHGPNLLRINIRVADRPTVRLVD